MHLNSISCLTGMASSTKPTKKALDPNPEKQELLNSQGAQI